MNNDRSAWIGLGLPFLYVFPEPDGDLTDAEDRIQLLSGTRDVGSAVERGSWISLALPFGRILPVSDGSFDQLDRFQLAYLYRLFSQAGVTLTGFGITATADEVIPTGNTIVSPNGNYATGEADDVTVVTATLAIPQSATTYAEADNPVGETTFYSTWMNGLWFNLEWYNAYWFSLISGETAHPDGVSSTAVGDEVTAFSPDAFPATVLASAYAGGITVIAEGGVSVELPWVESTAFAGILYPGPGITVDLGDGLPITDEAGNQLTDEFGNAITDESNAGTLLSTSAAGTVTAGTFTLAEADEAVATATAGEVTLYIEVTTVIGYPQGRQSYAYANEVVVEIGYDSDADYVVSIQKQERTKAVESQYTIKQIEYQDRILNVED